MTLFLIILDNILKENKFKDDFRDKFSFDDTCR